MPNVQAAAVGATASTAVQKESSKLLDCAKCSAKNCVRTEFGEVVQGNQTKSTYCPKCGHVTNSQVKAD